MYSAEEDYFRDGLIASQLRGQDSTGVAIVNFSGKKHSTHILKAAQYASSFVARDDLRKLFQRNRNMKVMMGHTRFATQGSVCDKNAHPFEHEHIVLAHNGGVWNKNDLPDGAKYDVDSEAICHSIAKIGAIKTLRLINGAFALSYFDLDQQRFNLIRNEGRPLFIAKHKHRKAYFYASEGEMLLWILRRNKIEYEKVDLLPESHLASFNCKDDTFEIREVNYEKILPEIDKSKWHQQGGQREASTEDKTEHRTFVPAVNNNSGGYSQSSDRERADEEAWSNARGRQASHALARTSMTGPHGAGADYLNKWSLRYNDIVMVYIPDFEAISPRANNCKALAYFGGKDSPDCDIWVFGFTEDEYRSVENTGARYFSRIASCYWDSQQKKYVMHLTGVFDSSPEKDGKVVIPKDKYGHFNTTKTHIKAKVELPALPAPPKEAVIPHPIHNIHLDESKHEVLLSSEILTQIAEAAAADQAALEESFLKYRKSEGTKKLISTAENLIVKPPFTIDNLDDIVPGPGGSSIKYREWIRKTKDGCGYCTGPIEWPRVAWVGESPIHIDCQNDLADAVSRGSRSR